MGTVSLDGVEYDLHDMTQRTEYWLKYAKKHLEGRKIVDVRYLKDEEVEALGWHRSTVVMQLDNGTLLFPSQDEEGNGPGVMFGQGAKPRCVELVFPTL